MMRAMASVLAALLLGSALPALGQPSTTAGPPTLTGDVVYRMTLVRAAPGRYDALLDAVRRHVAARAGAGRGAAFRHSQGDQWDVLLLLPIGAVPSRVEAAGRGADADRDPLAPLFEDALVAWQEDEIVRGPVLDVLPGFFDAGLYHFEMFDAAPGRIADLVREREMENAYLSGVGRPRNLIFTRVFGAAWDVFTLGAYRDWRHYAERDLVTPEKALAAARAAGFESDAAVGPYMRTLILSHQDTLATGVRDR